MTKVTVTTWVKVTEGPRLTLNNEVEPETVTQSTVQLDEAGGTTPKQTVELLADGGTVVLLAVAAQTEDGEPAQISLKPVNGTKKGSDLTVDGGFAAVSADVLGALVDGGPRSVEVTNAGSAAVTVKLVAGRSD